MFVASIECKFYFAVDIDKKKIEPVNPVVRPIVCTTSLNVQKFFVLPLQCIYVCGMELRIKRRLFSYAALTEWFL
jgi:hypothetical protein